MKAGRARKETAMTANDQDRTKINEDIFDDVATRVVLIVIAALVAVFGYFVFKTPTVLVAFIFLPGVLITVCAISLINIILRR